jgi:hypothetical protein
VVDRWGSEPPGLDFRGLYAFDPLAAENLHESVGSADRLLTALDDITI